MADDAGHKSPNIEPEPSDSLAMEDMDFFRLLELLERPGQRFGRSGGPDREPARLGQTARLGFAAQDVASLVPPTKKGRPLQVSVNVIGLLGPEGPMPLHITRWVRERQSNRWFAGDDAGALSDTSFLDFVNMLQHRMMTFYWRAWADTRPTIDIVQTEGGRVTAMLQALAGLGLPGTHTKERDLNNAKLRHATSLVQVRHSPERLAAFVESVVDAPVRMLEFVGNWMDIPAPIQTRLGATYAGLGTQAVVGARSFDRLSRIELLIGPLSLDQFQNLLQDRALWDKLRHGVVFASGRELDVDLRLILRASDVPKAQLGNCQLGRTAWLAKVREHDADDLCMTRITRDPSERQAA